MFKSALHNLATILLLSFSPLFHTAIETQILMGHSTSLILCEKPCGGHYNTQHQIHDYSHFYPNLGVANIINIIGMAITTLIYVNLGVANASESSEVLLKLEGKKKSLMN